MGRRGRIVLIAVIACLLVLGWAVLQRYYSSPQRVLERGRKTQQAYERKRFIAAFDSLKQARLYPTAWRSGSFTKTAFDANREEWLLTIDLSDWERRSEASKMDLAGRLYVTFQGIRAEAGGDPELARFVIQSEDGEKLAECSASKGTEILK
jgi:hypothetical protein